MLSRLLLLAAVLATAVLADRPAQNSALMSNEAASGDVPPGVVVMTSIQGIVLQPTSSTIAKNDIAVGNNVLISKSNVDIAAGAGKQRLVQEIESLVLASRPDSEDNSVKLISDLIGPTNPKSSGESDWMKGTLQEQIHALFLMRSDSPKL